MAGANLRLTPRLLLSGYAQGIFPMALSQGDDELHWFDPPRRGVLPLDRFHASRSLRRTIARGDWRATLNADFASTVDACAAQDETWINAPLRRLYLDLHDLGHAHSVEVWQGDDLAGAAFGVSLGGAFFGESMVSLRTGGSKAALWWLTDQLTRCGFTLLDTQYLTPHLASLGGAEIPRAAYRRALADALPRAADLTRLPLASSQEIRQRITQTS
ncbi:leucyl/phenylalanyl-tRNA--protein transferase [Paracoccus sp. p4-l81]|uniref:leucyl/phenylalanyl-tRNA--protein transferase n=1 Tax=Paracoccus sp. p4-l81 TaxID=3342806 RepID=UPI0035BB0D7B